MSRNVGILLLKILKINNLKSIWSLFKRSPGNPRNSRELGEFGENRAAEYLMREKDLKIVCRNWRDGRDEIDLVAWDREVLVFVEVRTRQTDALVSGYHSVGVKKKKVLQRVFRAYRKSLRPHPKHYRFDIVDVAYRSASDFQVYHYSCVPIKF